MRQRLFCFAILLVLGCVARAQDQDFTKVEIKTTQLADGLYLLQGAGGMFVYPPAAVRFWCRLMMMH